MKNGRSRVAILLSGLFLCSLAAAQQSSECTILGEIHVPGGGFPGKRILVSLETRGANIASVYTDDEGRFLFAHLEGNLYHVVVNDDDYFPVSASAAVTPISSPTIRLRIDLAPRSDQRGSAGDPAHPGANSHMMDSSGGHQDSARISGGNPYLMDEAKFAAQFPTKVMKEFDAGVKADRKLQYADALSHYSKALKVAPGFYPARNNLGLDYLNQGNSKNAEAEFLQVIKQNPDDAAAYLNLGNLQFIAKRYSEAGPTLQEGLKRQPNSALGHFLLGSLFQEVRNGPEAEKHLRRALELDAAMTKAHLTLANVYIQQQRAQDAIVELEQFLKVDPNNPMAPRAREVVKKLQAQVTPKDSGK